MDVCFTVREGAACEAAVWLRDDLDDACGDAEEVRSRDVEELRPRPRRERRDPALGARRMGAATYRERPLETRLEVR